MNYRTLALAALTSLIIPLSASAEETEYSSTGFSAEVTENGEIKNLRVGDNVLINHLYLIGDYRPALAVNDHDARFYQFQEKSPATISSPDATTLVVEKDGAILGNAKFPQGAVYKEKITFTPDRIRAEYEVEIAVPIDSQLGIFSTLCEIPLSLVGAGYQATDDRDSETMGVIPREYSESDSLKVRARKLAVAIPGGIVTVEGDQGTGLFFADARRWKEAALRLDIGQQMPWHQTPITFNPGTKFKWAFTISYAPEEK